MERLHCWLSQKKTKQKCAFEQGLNFPKAWINLATISPDVYLVFVAVILLEPGWRICSVPQHWEARGAFCPSCAQPSCAWCWRASVFCRPEFLWLLPFQFVSFAQAVEKCFRFLVSPALALFSDHCYQKKSILDHCKISNHKESIVLNTTQYLWLCWQTTPWLCQYLSICYKPMFSSTPERSYWENKVLRFLIALFRFGSPLLWDLGL